MTSEYNTIIYDFIPPVDNGYRRYIAVGNSKRTVFKAENEYIIAEREKAFLKNYIQCISRKNCFSLF